MPALFTGRFNNEADEDPLEPTSYDDRFEPRMQLSSSLTMFCRHFTRCCFSAGFVIFYDFLLGLGESAQFVRLVTCLYNKESQFSPPTTLETLQTEPQQLLTSQYDTTRDERIAVLRQTHVVTRYLDPPKPIT